MKKSVPNENNKENISDFVYKTYKIYVEHYKERQLTPMPLSEFVKNYA